MHSLNEYINCFLNLQFSFLQVTISMALVLGQSFFDSCLSSVGPDFLVLSTIHFLFAAICLLLPLLLLYECSYQVVSTVDSCCLLYSIAFLSLALICVKIVQVRPLNFSEHRGFEKIFTIYQIFPYYYLKLILSLGKSVYLLPTSDPHCILTFFTIIFYCCLTNN